MAEPLTIEGELLPLLLACRKASFWGSLSIVWEDGRPVDLELRQRMRLRDQVRLAIKRMLGMGQ